MMSIEMALVYVPLREFVCVCVCVRARVRCPPGSPSALARPTGSHLGGPTGYK